MIDIAARATNGVKLPNRKATQEHIIARSKENLTNLDVKLMVSVYRSRVPCLLWLIDF